MVNGKTEAASSQNAAATGGFCCYRGKSFAKDMCIWAEHLVKQWIFSAMWLCVYDI